MCLTVHVRRALLSVSNKSGIIDFAQGLVDLGIEVISTGGSAKTLKQAGINVRQVSDITGFPEMLGGRVKTLHPKIHGGILARRPQDQETLTRFDIPEIDMVVVNLYPFEQTIAKADCTLADAIESIDIGGPAMIRAAAKNFSAVVAVTDPDDYRDLLQRLQENAGQIAVAQSKQLAAKAFALCARYNQAIAQYLQPNSITNDLPQEKHFSLKRKTSLRYGENPHQQAAIYEAVDQTPDGILASEQYQGKPLSYNNFQDAHATWQAVMQFQAPTCVIVKHANPCAIASRAQLMQAYQAAFSADPTSAFGGILGFNQTLDAQTAQTIIETQFAEVILAPDITAEAQEVLSKKNNLRVLKVPKLPINQHASYQWHSLGNGFLCQQTDTLADNDDSWQVVTSTQPCQQQWRDLKFAWVAVRHVKSNAIVFAKNETTCAIGAGQMSRVFAIDIAGMKARQAQQTLANSALASDAFFPFADGVEQAVQAGASCIIQPGGSIRDEEVIAKANELGIVMVFTGQRHFKH